MFSYLWLSDLTTAHAICQDRTGTFDKGATGLPHLRQIVPTGMVCSPTNSQWKHHRRIMGPAMAGTYLAKTVTRTNESILDLVSLWKTKSSLAKGEPFEALKDMENTAMVRCLSLLEQTESN